MTRTAPALGVAALLALAAGLAPLWTYAASLAAFGGVHVLSELRYVDGRFGARVSRPFALWLGVALAGVLLFRALGWAGLLGDPAGAARTELLLGALLAIPVGLFAAPLSVAARLLLPVTVFALSAAALLAPLATLVVVAWLHDATPVGFVAERLEGRARRRALALSLVLFVLVPVALAAGALRPLASWGADGPLAWTFPSAGPLATHLPVFVLPAVGLGPRAVDLFSAAVYLQGLHYVAVIVVLPRLGPGEGARPWLRWPRGASWALALAAVGAVSLVLFARAFRDARAGYGLLAAVHVWLEVPVLLLALAGRGAARGAEATT